MEDGLYPARQSYRLKGFWRKATVKSATPAGRALGVARHVAFFQLRSHPAIMSIKNLAWGRCQQILPADPALKNFLYPIRPPDRKKPARAGKRYDPGTREEGRTSKGQRRKLCRGIVDRPAATATGSRGGWSTARTWRASSTGLKGFWRKATDKSATPCWTRASSV